MLSLPELSQSDSRLPFAGTAAKQGAEGKDAATAPARGFAEMLTAAVPPKEAATTSSGEQLPAGGKELPQRRADAAGELPAATIDSAIDDAVESTLQALPVTPGDLLQGGMPRIEPGAESPATTDPVALEQSKEASTDAELAALQLMLPPLNTGAEVAAQAPASSSAQQQTVAIAAGGLAANNGSATSATRPGSNGHRHGGLSGLPMNEAAVPAESTALLRDAQKPTATVENAVSAGKAFAELLSGSKEIRLESHDTLPRIQPLAAPVTGLNSPPSALPAAPTAINLPVTDTRWGDALGERVTWMAGQKLDSAEIRLNPAELGPIRIKITLEDNQAQVTFTAHHAVTRDAIEQALPRLRELFSGEGLNLSNADVNGDGVRHEQGESGRGDDGLGGHDQLLADADEDEGSMRPSVRIGSGLVDTFV